MGPVCPSSQKESDKMQLHIRGNLNYVLEFATGNESCAELKAKIAQKEGSEDVLLYVAGKPVDIEMPVSSIGDFHVDVTVPLLGGKVHGSLARAGKVKPPKLKPKRRKRRRPDAPRGESNTTDDLSTLFKPSVANVDPTLIHKSVLYILFLEE